MSTKFNIIYFLLCFIMLAWTGSTFSQQLVKIGLVDIKRIYSEYRAVEETRQVWQGIFKDYQDDLNTTSQEIEVLKEELKEKGLLLTENEKKNLEREIENREAALIIFAGRQQDRLSKQKGELIRKLESDIQRSIKKIGIQEGFSLILDKSNSFYNITGTDLTDKVIELLNGREG